jgi:hypothetical protein
VLFAILGEESRSQVTKCLENQTRFDNRSGKWFFQVHLNESNQPNITKPLTKRETRVSGVCIIIV